MRKLGIILLTIGAVSLLLVLLPNSLYYAIDFGRNLIRFINNYLIIIAIFLISAGWASMVAGKRRLERRENY